jgi:hypothetical protein
MGARETLAVVAVPRPPRALRGSLGEDKLVDYNVATAVVTAW